MDCGQPVLRRQLKDRSGVDSGSCRPHDQATAWLRATCHIRSWISELTYICLPNWFKEGLAVAVSCGDGAESASETQAMAAIQRDDHIAIAGSGSRTELSGVKFEHEQPYASFRFELAYRQAGMFVSYLRDADPSGFARMINSILAGHRFEEAVAVGYQENLQNLLTWERAAREGGGSGADGVTK
jgi:hypothetical protein